MKEGHIYVYGDIFNEQSDYAKEYGIVSLSDIVNQIKQNEDADKLIVHIHSRGGDVYEGFAIHDVLVNSKKEITTIIEGLCASIATVISLAGTTRQMLENSEFMIHNPTTAVYGDAEEIQKMADRIQAEQDRIIDFYVDKTGGGRDKIEKLVNEETFMTADEAKELGFVTEVVETIEALAIFGNINHKNNSKMEVEKELKGLSKLVQSLVDLYKGKAPENLTLSSVDGVKLIFDTEEPQVTVGDKVSCENGEQNLDEATFLMPEGETIVIKNRVVESIVPKEEEVQNTAEVEKLQENIDTLTEEITALKDAAKVSNSNYESTIKGIQENVEFLTKNITSQHEPGTPGTVFKKKEPEVKETAIQAALRIKREARAAN